MQKQLYLALLIAFIPLTTEAEDITKCKSGWAATQAGDYLTAIALFNACIKEGELSQASLARTYRNIGITYRQAKEPQKAIEAHTMAIAIGPTDIADDYINRGNAYDEAGMFNKAMADYDKALELKPGHGEAFYNRGIAYERQLMFEKAKAEFISAYNHGLRTRLLYERFIAHGLPIPTNGSD